jgi:peptide/nickel transport system permease protein
MTTLRRILKRKSALISLIFIAFITLAAIFAPLIAPYAPNEQFKDGLTLQGAPIAPGGNYLFGTDLLGRDLLSRLIYGARTSLIVGIIANGIAILLGTTVGIIAGYVKGRTGALMMRFTDLMMAFPALLLAITLAAIFSPSLLIVALVIAMVNWVQIARVIYTQAISISEREFVTAARGLGATNQRVLLKHILPHLLPTVLVYATLGIATTVPPTPSWGNIIFENQTYFITAPWLVFIPGISIILLALSFNLLGDALRDELDPTQRGLS